MISEAGLNPCGDGVISKECGPLSCLLYRYEYLRFVEIWCSLSPAYEHSRGC